MDTPSFSAIARTRKVEGYNWLKQPAAFSYLANQISVDQIHPMPHLKLMGPELSDPQHGFL